MADDERRYTWKASVAMTEPWGAEIAALSEEWDRPVGWVIRALLMEALRVRGREPSITSPVDGP